MEILDESVSVRWKDPEPYAYERNLDLPLG